jgi:hypothetical protein
MFNPSHQQRGDIEYETEWYCTVLHVSKCHHNTKHCICNNFIAASVV